MLRRQEYKVDLTNWDDPKNKRRKKVKEGQGNLFSSELVGQKGYYVPTLDIDLECELHESSTPGHYHLYIDKPMTWEQYTHLLITLEEVGIIQRGFAQLSLDREATFLRKPGVKKQPGDMGDS